MNAQDPVFNTLLDNVATPDKPESPIIAGTGSLEDDFTISEAGDNPVLPENDEASVENPLLHNDPDAGSQIIDVVTLTNRLDLTEQFRWDYNTISPTIIYHNTKTTGNIVRSLLISLLLLMIAIIISILIFRGLPPTDDIVLFIFALIFEFSIPVLLSLVFYIIALYIIAKLLINIYHSKTNYTLKIIIHSDEILLEEMSKSATRTYALPRNSKDLQVIFEDLKINFIPIKTSLLNLYKISFRNQRSYFYLDKAFNNKDASDLFALFKQICIVNQLASTSSQPAPNHLDSSAQLIDSSAQLIDSSAQLIDSSAQLIDSSAQLTNNDSDEDYFL